MAIVQKQAIKQKSFYSCDLVVAFLHLRMVSNSQADSSYVYILNSK